MITNQEEFTEAIQSTLEHLALENAKMLAAQLVSMVSLIQTQPKTPVCLFYERKDIPNEYLDLADDPYAYDWCVLVPMGVDKERWYPEDYDRESVELPNGDFLVFGQD